MGLNRLLTDVVLQRLQALRAAFRVGGVRTPTQDAEAIRASYGYPTPLHVTGPNTGDVHRLTPGRQDCPICRELAPSVAPAEPIGPIEDIRQAVEQIIACDFAPLDAAMLGSFWIPGALRASSWTAERTLEEIRRLTTEGTGGGAAAYPPVEGPTSACFQCGRNVPPADLFVGKHSGIALCEPCLEKWEKAGRARRTGEF